MFCPYSLEAVLLPATAAMSPTKLENLCTFLLMSQQQLCNTSRDFGADFRVKVPNMVGFPLEPPTGDGFVALAA